MKNTQPTLEIIPKNKNITSNYSFLFLPKQIYLQKNENLLYYRKMLLKSKTDVVLFDSSGSRTSLCALSDNTNSRDEEDDKNNKKSSKMEIDD